MVCMRAKDLNFDSEQGYSIGWRLCAPQALGPFWNFGDMCEYQWHIKFVWNCFGGWGVESDRVNKFVSLKRRSARSIRWRKVSPSCLCRISWLATVKVGWLESIDLQQSNWFGRTGFGKACQLGRITLCLVGSSRVGSNRAMPGWVRSVAFRIHSFESIAFWGAWSFWREKNLLCQVVVSKRFPVFIHSSHSHFCGTSAFSEGNHFFDRDAHAPNCDTAATKWKNLEERPCLTIQQSWTRYRHAANYLPNQPLVWVRKNYPYEMFRPHHKGNKVHGTVVWVPIYILF